MNNSTGGSKSRRVVGITSILIISVFVIGLILVLLGILNKSEGNKVAGIKKNMEDIYTSAIIVDEIDVGLHEDSDNAGKYEKLSEMSGFRVYNTIQDKKYSVSKDYKSGKITVHYGKDLKYPEVHEPMDRNLVVDDVSTEDLFNYDESSGKVVVTGFSEIGVSLLQSKSVIQIPSSYNGRDVVEIAEKAFYNKNIMGTVIIPESIQKIGRNAFSNNGVKGVSDNISQKPYAGSWVVDEKTWKKVE